MLGCVRIGLKKKLGRVRLGYVRLEKKVMLGRFKKIKVGLV